MKRKNKNKKGMRVMTIAVAIILVILTVSLVATTLRSVMINKRPENAVFLNGSTPEPALDGTYKGNTQSQTGWQGKWFESSKNKGLNNFSDGDRYEFKTSTEKSLSSDKKVLKLDYNHPGNPLWLRLIVDEVSQVNTGTYQGKVYIKLGPIYFTLTYFELNNQ